MTGRRGSLLLLVAAFMLLPLTAGGQFKSNAFSQSYNDDQPTDKDSVDVLFSFPEFLGGLRHEREARIGTLFGGSTVFIGAQQIYNKQYWKLPIVYGTTLGALGAGVGLSASGKHEAAKYCFIGAGLAYWGTLMDGVINYKPDPYPYPGKATIFSILLPGLGQAYNGEFWKIPVYLGGMVASVYFLSMNQKNFTRFRNIYIEATDPEVPYTGPIPAETAIYYRNTYRTYRDYSIVALGLVYLLQIIDANVFAYMHNFEVNDNIAFDLSPTVIIPDNQLAVNMSPSAVGVRLGLSF